MQKLMQKQVNPAFPFVRVLFSLKGETMDALSANLDTPCKSIVGGAPVLVEGLEGVLALGQNGYLIVLNDAPGHEITLFSAAKAIFAAANLKKMTASEFCHELRATLLGHSEAIKAEFGKVMGFLNPALIFKSMAPIHSIAESNARVIGVSPRQSGLTNALAATA